MARLESIRSILLMAHKWPNTSMQSIWRLWYGFYCAMREGRIAFWTWAVFMLGRWPAVGNSFQDRF